MNIIISLAVVDGKVLAGPSNIGIYSSSDNGATWSKMDSQLNDENITDILVKGDTLFATGNRDVYISTDYGINWAKTVTHNNNFLTEIFVTDGIVFAAGWEGVYYSLDQGISWVFAKDGFPEIAAANSFFADGTQLLAGTSRGVWSIPLSDFDPVIESVSPDAGGPNEFVTISGKNFNPSLSTNIVLFNGEQANVLQATDKLLTVAVPDGATSGYISVVINRKTAESPLSFCVRAAGPIISAEEPNTLPVVISSNVSGIQWYLNGFPISEATESTYTATQNGVYTAKIIGGACDSQLSNPIAIVITDAEESRSNAEKLTVYPNPASHNIVLIMDQPFSAEPTQVEIFGANGQQKEYVRLPGRSTEISLAGYSAGLYFIRVIRKGKTITTRFLKTGE
jgi:hypothetical protein